MSGGALSPVNSWSSEIAYYSQRKALTVMDKNIKVVQHDPVAFLGGMQLGAMIFCGENRNDSYGALMLVTCTLPAIPK